MNNPYHEYSSRHLFDELSRKLIGIAIQVHKTLGPGYLENIYEEALKIELRKNNFNYETQKEIEITYCEKIVGTHRLDLMIESSVILELKAVKQLVEINYAQLRSYLKATGLRVGLLLNFGTPTLEIKRVVN